MNTLILLDIYKVLCYNMGTLKGDIMKFKALKALIVLVIAVGSQDLKLASLVVGIYIVSEVVVMLSLKLIRASYTNKLIESGIFYKKNA